MRSFPFAALMEELGLRVTNLDGPEPVLAAGANDHAVAKPADLAGQEYPGRDSNPQALASSGF